MTFDRHPATVVRPESAPLLLTDLEQKLELLAVGRDRPHGGGALRRGPGQRDGRGLRARGPRAGPGRKSGGGGGGLPLRPRPGRQRGPAHRDGRPTTGSTSPAWRLEQDATDEVVSSTRIRELLASCDVAGAAAMLGRAHQVRGVVVHGDGRGARSSVPHGQRRGRRRASPCPARGSTPAGTSGPTARSTPPRPRWAGVRRSTSRPMRRLLEVFLLDFNGDLYGEAARVSFVEHLREERRFESTDALVAPDDRGRGRRPAPRWASPPTALRLTRRPGLLARVEVAAGAGAGGSGSALLEYGPAGTPSRSDPGPGRTSLRA